MLSRLARIEALTQAGAEPAAVLGELRELLAEAEAWSQREGGEAARLAVAGLRSALERDMIAV